MGFGLNMISHLACIYYVGRSYFYFRKSGGIKGLNPTKDLPEDKAIAKTRVVADAVIEKAMKKMDEADMEKDDGFKAIQNS